MDLTMAQAVNVLTVQDHLFINLQVSKKQHNWNYARLEEAVFYQYGYGTSTDVLGQAARYANNFSRKAPFAAANVATGFVGLLSFLKINGYEFDLAPADAGQWWQILRNSGDATKGKLTEFAQVEEHSQHVEVSDVIQGILSTYSEAIAAMVSEETRMAS